MKLNKKYSFSDGNQLWRIIPDEKDKLLIETRDIEKKEVFFNYLHIETGKKIFYGFQLEEKFWIGIEAIRGNLIIFHKFAKPDMPGHKGIIVYDTAYLKVAWETDEYAFLFSTPEKVYCFKQKFEGRDFLALDINTGKIEENLGNDFKKVNLLRQKAEEAKDYSSYKFPEIFEENITDLKISENISKIINGAEKEGPVEFIKYDEHLFLNYHLNKGSSGLRNIFKVVELQSSREIKNLILNNNVNAYAPDSFFIKDDLLFTLVEKTELVVYKLES